MIGESAGSVYIEIYGNNQRLANDLKQTDSLIRRHAAAMAGLKLFQPGLFSSQMSAFQGMAKGSAVLYSQLNMMAGLTPKLGAMVAPFMAMRNAMASFRNVVDPGNIVRTAKAQSVAAIAEHDKMAKSLSAKIGLTPDSAVKGLAHYVAVVNKAKSSIAGASVDPLRQKLELQSQIDAREKLAIAKSVYKNKEEAAALEPFKVELQQADKAVEKLTADLDKQKKATEALAAAQAKLAAASQSMRGKIGTDRLSVGDVTRQLTPHVNAIDAAKKNLESAQGTSKLDIMGGGALSGIMNVIAGVVSGFKLVWGVASSIFGILRGIGSAIISVAQTIVHAIGSAFEFVKNLAVSIFKTVSVAAIAVGGALVAGLRSVFEKGKNLLNAFAQTGIKVKDAVVIETAASMTGVNADLIATQINRMQRAISGIDKEGPKIHNALKYLGIDMAALQAMSPTDQMTAIAHGLAKITDPAQRAGVAINIFSVRGSQMISMLLQMAEAIKLSKQQWGLAADAFDKNKDKFAYVARSIEGITHVKIPSFFAGIATPLLNTLSWLSDKLNAFDPFKSGFKIGTKIDEYLRLIIGAFQKGRLMEWLGLELKVAFLEAVNYLIAGFMIAGDVLSSVLHIEGLFPLIAQGLAGVFQFAVGTFLQAFQGILPELGAGIGWLVDKLIIGVRYAGNMLLGGSIGGLTGAVGGGAVGGLIAGPAGIVPGAYIGATVLGATGVAAGAGMTDSNATTDYQDRFRYGAAALNLPHRATGGPVKAGQAYMVGENGPEPFIPSMDGTILAHNFIPAPHPSANDLPVTRNYTDKSGNTFFPHLDSESAANKSGREWGNFIAGGTPPQSIQSLAQTPSQKMVDDGMAKLNDALNKMAASFPDLMAKLAKSVDTYLHPDKVANAKKDALIKERDTLQAQEKQLQENMANPLARDNANAQLNRIRPQIEATKNQLNNPELSDRQTGSLQDKLTKLQAEETYYQSKVTEEVAYRAASGKSAKDDKRLKHIQNQIKQKEKEITAVDTGPKDVMGAKAKKAELAALRKQLIATGLTGTGGAAFNVNDKPATGSAGVAAIAGTMSGFGARNIGMTAHASGGDKHMAEIAANTGKGGPIVSSIEQLQQTVNQ